MSDGLHFELVGCERLILQEIAEGQTQKSVALTYAMAVRSRERKTIDWPKVNRAIRERWTGRTALERVKRMAWEYLTPDTEEQNDE